MRLRRPGPTLRDLLAEARGRLEPADRYALLGHALDRGGGGRGHAPGGRGKPGRGREFVLAHPEYRPTRSQLRSWRAALRRRLGGEPTAYITGRKEFYGLCFRVKHTLIPRPETELLVDEVLRLSPASLLDVGTGSGAIAVVVKHLLPDCRVTAIEASGPALRTARKNARGLLGRGAVSMRRARSLGFRGDRRFQVIVSNPPYVKTGDLGNLPPEVRREPRAALDGGPDGLRAYRMLLAGGLDRLDGGGMLVLEIDPALREAILGLPQARGYRLEKIGRDLAGMERLLVLSRRE